MLGRPQSFSPFHSDLGVTFVQLQALHSHLKNWGEGCSWSPEPACLSVAGTDVGAAPHHVAEAVYSSSRAKALTSSSASWLS